jgi:hypothetical protein
VTQGLPSWHFTNSETSARTRSMVLFLIHDQQSRSTSRLRASGVRHFQPFLSPRILCTRSSRSGTTRHLKSTALVHFMTLAFGSLKFPHFLPPRRLPPRVHDLSTGVLPQIDGYESLQLFKLLEFQTLHLHFLSE